MSRASASGMGPRLLRPAGAGARRRGIARANSAVPHSPVFGPNMTPMVDVVMVILVFFMAGMAFVAPELFITTGISSSRGEGAGAARDPFELPPATFTVTLRRESGTTLVDGLGLAGGAIRELEDAARGLLERGEIGVLIAPASDVPVEDVLLAQGTCARAGVERVALRVD